MKAKIITIINILLIVIVILSIFSFVVPIKKVWLSDNVIYGSSFCNTFDGSCISTKGHFTMEKLTLYELLIKYKGQWKEKPKQ